MYSFDDRNVEFRPTYMPTSPEFGETFGELEQYRCIQTDWGNKIWVKSPDRNDWNWKRELRF